MINNLDMKDDNSNLLCDYTGTTFVDKYHNHIIASNIKIIENNMLRKPFFKGPKYGQNKVAGYQKAKNKT